jgi:phosphoserine aminotransferase
MGRHSLALCTFPLTLSEAMNQITIADIHSEFTKLDSKPFELLYASWQKVTRYGGNSVLR